MSSLNQGQAEDIKRQLVSHIETNFPMENREYAKQQILSMSAEELEDFLIENNLIRQSSMGAQSITRPESSQMPTPQSEKIQTKHIHENQQGLKGQPMEGIFRAIVEGQIPSYTIDENKYAKAVLEINPISKGHIIIIPVKKVVDTSKMPSPVLSLAKSISKTMKNKLNPKEIKIELSNVLGEIIINVLPVYSDESLSSKRHKADHEELESTKQSLSAKKPSQTPSVKKVKNNNKTKKLEKPEENIRIPRRIP